MSTSSMSTRTIRTFFTLRAAVVVAAIAALALASACDDGGSDATATPDTPSPTATGTVGTPTPTGTGAPTTSPTTTPSPTTPGTTPSATPGGNPDGEPTAEDAIDVIEAYYTAIAAEDYETAYALWRDGGDASGQTFEEFVAGFAETASVTWEIGEPGRIDPGAGQRYIEIPVTVTAETTDGETQRFEGTYVLHHTADIEGATDEQRVWRLHSASIEQVE